MTTEGPRITQQDSNHVLNGLGILIETPFKNANLVFRSHLQSKVCLTPEQRAGLRDADENKSTEVMREWLCMQDIALKYPAEIEFARLYIGHIDTMKNLDKIEADKQMNPKAKITLQQLKLVRKKANDNYVSSVFELDKKAAENVQDGLTREQMNDIIEKVENAFEKKETKYFG